MKIYVMRHGTTNWNEKGIVQGRSQNRLSEEGKKLAEQSAEKYKNKQIDVIFTSPLMRTMQTTNFMNKYHNCKIIKDERLIEIDQGIFTGRKKADLTEEELKLKNLKSKACKMENYDEVFERVSKFLNYLKETSFENVLIVTHNCVTLNIEHILTGEKILDIKNYANAEVREFVV